MTEQKELKVWVGKPEDVDDIMELAMSACEENGFAFPNPMKLLAEIWPALNRERGIVGIIGLPGEKPHGAILLRIGHLWYSDEPILEGLCKLSFFGVFAFIECNHGFTLFRN